MNQITSQARLPESASISRLILTAEAGNTSQAVYQFTGPLPFRAYEIEKLDKGERHKEELWLLKIPGQYLTEDFPVEAVHTWMASQGAMADEGQQLLTFHGTQIVWSAHCIAIMADDSVMESVVRSCLEHLYYLRELNRIEAELQEMWPQAEQDVSMAFEFNQSQLLKRPNLKQRFQQALLMQGRLSRMSSRINRPYLYPPTLASQIGERLCERLQLAHRHECLCDQLEILNGLYEQCSQRASDFVLTRSGNQLEWIIIILLLAQILLSGFDMLTSLETTATTTTATPATSDTTGQ
ncbi:MAG: hypothetical protein KDA78_14490 [Planctomycetaceae bacterium]|nr:hypothetical protein [Planctomycetaceae bacterium]